MRRFCRRKPWMSIWAAPYTTLRKWLRKGKRFRLGSMAPMAEMNGPLDREPCRTELDGRSAARPGDPTPEPIGRHRAINQQHRPDHLKWCGHVWMNEVTTPFRAEWSLIAVAALQAAQNSRTTWSSAPAASSRRPLGNYPFKFDARCDGSDHAALRSAVAGLARSTTIGVPLKLAQPLGTSKAASSLNRL